MPGSRPDFSSQRVSFLGDKPGYFWSVKVSRASRVFGRSPASHTVSPKSTASRFFLSDYYCLRAFAGGSEGPTSSLASRLRVPRTGFSSRRMGLVWWTQASLPLAELSQEPATMTPTISFLEANNSKDDITAI